MDTCRRCCAAPQRPAPPKLADASHRATGVGHTAALPTLCTQTDTSKHQVVEVCKATALAGGRGESPTPWTIGMGQTMAKLRRPPPT